MKEQIEKMLKRNLKRKLAITTATLIAFLLSANLAFAGGIYKVGNEGIKRKLRNFGRGNREFEKDRSI